MYTVRSTRIAVHYSVFTCAAKLRKLRWIGSYFSYRARASPLTLENRTGRPAPRPTSTTALPCTVTRYSLFSLKITTHTTPSPLSSVCRSVRTARFHWRAASHPHDQLRHIGGQLLHHVRILLVEEHAVDVEGRHMDQVAEVPLAHFEAVLVDLRLLCLWRRQLLR